MAAAVQQEEAIVCADQQVDPPQSPTQDLPIELPLVLTDLRRLGEEGEEGRKKGKETDEPVSYQERSSLTIFGPSCFTPPFSPGSCMLRRGPGSSKWCGLAEGDGRPGPLRVSGGK